MIKCAYRYFIAVTIGLLFNIYIFLPLCFAQQERSGNPEYIFFRANSYYEEGKYDDAIDEYSKLLARGVEGGNLYYNLGNSYFKKGELGKAILYYEKAKRLVPRDSDLKSNYKFAGSQIEYDVSGSSTTRYERAFSIFNMLTVNEMTVLLSAVFTLAVLFLIKRLFITVAGRYSILFMAVSLIVFVLIAVPLFYRVSLLDKEAIVMSRSPEALFEPLDNATAHFTLYEGMKVHMLQSKKDWYKVKRADGKVGWVRARDIEKI
ncbi:MAG: tetratricopeptide repeat protein [Thermodesulfovibrionia bacterium]|nr:tetratricopeptide repeat protein [Thermodesulfovibrionia bacterium]